MPHDEEHQNRRHDQDRDRRPEHGQQLAGAVKKFGGIAAIGENRDDRGDEDRDHHTRTRTPDRRGRIDAAVGESEKTKEQVLFRLLAQIGARSGHNRGHDGEDDDDPDQDRNVPEDLDIDGHQLAHEPVVRQPENTGDHAEDSRGNAGQERDKQRVQNADDRGTAVARLTVILDQSLVDVVTGRFAEKRERDVQTGFPKVLDKVVTQIPDRERQQDCSDGLECKRTIPGIVNQHRQAKRPLFRIRHCGHSEFPFPAQVLQVAAPCRPASIQTLLFSCGD